MQLYKNRDQAKLSSVWHLFVIDKRITNMHESTHFCMLSSHAPSTPPIKKNNSFLLIMLRVQLIAGLGCCFHGHMLTSEAWHWKKLLPSMVLKHKQCYRLTWALCDTFYLISPQPNWLSLTWMAQQLLLIPALVHNCRPEHLQATRMSKKENLSAFGTLRLWARYICSCAC